MKKLLGVMLLMISGAALSAPVSYTIDGKLNEMYELPYGISSADFRMVLNFDTEDSRCCGYNDPSRNLTSSNWYFESGSITFTNRSDGLPDITSNLLGRFSPGTNFPVIYMSLYGHDGTKSDEMYFREAYFEDMPGLYIMNLQFYLGESFFPPNEFPLLPETFEGVSPVFDGRTARVSDSGSQGKSRVVDAEISVVPIPAALWLFGSGLGLLGWMRRKPS